MWLAGVVYLAFEIGWQPDCYIRGLGLDLEEKAQARIVSALKKAFIRTVEIKGDEMELTTLALIGELCEPMNMLMR
jgi:hypothetical protein